MPGEENWEGAEAGRERLEMWCRSDTDERGGRRKGVWCLPRKFQPGQSQGMLATKLPVGQIWHWNRIAWFSYCCPAQPLAGEALGRVAWHEHPGSSEVQWLEIVVSLSRFLWGKIWAGNLHGCSCWAIIIVKHMVKALHGGLEKIKAFGWILPFKYRLVSLTAVLSCSHAQQRCAESLEPDETCPSISHNRKL